MLLLCERGVIASFMVYQTVKIWQAATLYNFLLFGGIPFRIGGIWKQWPLLSYSLRRFITAEWSREEAALRLPWKLINPNEIVSLPAWHAAFEPRWGEITVLQPLIYRVGTLHHTACATPEAAGAALAGAFQNSLYEVRQCCLRQAWSLNFVSFMQAVMNETGVLVYFWVVLYPQTKYLFKYYFQTVDIWRTAQIQTLPDQTHKTFFPLH